MIVKKVPTSKAAPARSKALNVRALADYIVGPTAGGAGEKVEHRGALNLLNIDHEGQVQEMIDLAEMAKRSPQPVQHWIMSWREGEQPSPRQADEAVRLFLDEMGLNEHQVLYGLHRDTENWHLHLAVNRVHPETETVVTVNNGFDHEVAHRAIARVERLQGWQTENRGLYRVLEGGQVERVQHRLEPERKPSSRARDLEERVGQRSAERIAIEDGADIIRRARTWREVHESLQQKGMRFEKKGSGAILWVGDEPVKASSAGRDCSMSALQKRLGEFAPPPEPARAVELGRVPEPADLKAPMNREYIQARQRHDQERAAVREQRAAQQREEWRRTAARHQRERADILRGSWKGRGALLNATRSVLAARQAQEKAALRDRQKLERAMLRRDLAPFPGYEEWLGRKSSDLAQQWRHRERSPAVIEGPTPEPPAPHDIRAFAAAVDGWKVHYCRAGDRGGPAFTDQGKEITIYESTRRESVLAALQLSAQKWGAFTIRGNEEFKRTCVELAAEHGFNITNPELQREIAVERERVPGAQSARRSSPERSEELGEAATMAEIYRRHREEVARQHVGRSADPSRLDAEVAVRMSVTGHTREAIAHAIMDGARVDRPNEKRDWNTYAQRAAAFAFGVPGSRLGEELKDHRQQFIRLEGREEGLEMLRGLGGPFRRL